MTTLTSTRRFRDVNQMWVIPFLYMGLALLLGRLIPVLDYASIDALRVGSFFSPSTATSILSSIASGMIAFTGVVFSMLFVMLQFGSAAYSPRLTGYLLRDPWLFHSLGIFAATFLYALVGLIFVDNYGAGYTPVLAVFIAILLVFVSMLVFLGLIRRIGAMQINHVLRMIAHRGRKEIESLFPLAGEEDSSLPPAPHPRDLPPETSILCYRGGPAVIVEIDTERLASLAQNRGGMLELEYGVGDTLTDGAELLRLRGSDGLIEATHLRGCLVIGPERTIKQDPKYAIRLIVDIAIRALSPAINDPTTAVQSLDLLEDLLRRITVRRLSSGVVLDTSGTLRLIYPTPSWEDILALAIDEIRYYGATSLQVMRRLHAMLDDLYETAPPARRSALLGHLQRVEASIQRSFIDPEDRQSAQKADRQGIGLTVHLEE